MTISESEIGLCLCLTIRLSRRRGVHRLEVITGTGRRRRFSDDYKSRIVEETLMPGRWFRMLPVGMGSRRSNCSAGAGKHGDLR